MLHKDLTCPLMAPNVPRCTYMGLDGPLKYYISGGTSLVNRYANQCLFTKTRLCFTDCKLALDQPWSMSPRSFNQR
jgi:hypothetical protein